MWVQPLGGEDPLEKEMAAHSSILSWRARGLKLLMGKKSGPGRHRAEGGGAAGSSSKSLACRSCLSFLLSHAHDGSQDRTP